MKALVISLLQAVGDYQIAADWPNKDLAAIVDRLREQLYSAIAELESKHLQQPQTAEMPESVAKLIADSRELPAISRVGEVGDILWLADQLAALQGASAPQRERPATPDYCYDPSHWEFTSPWEDRDTVHGDGDGLNHGELLRISTLLQGPDKWVVLVSGATDDDKDRIVWCDSEAEANAAAMKPSTAGT